LKKDKDQL